MGHFLSDFDKSKDAVELVRKYLEGEGYDVEELEKDEQQYGDLRAECGRFSETVEVKYDIMAKRTGNLCFEMSNGKRETGIMETKADWVYYVVPGKACKSVFVFDTKELKEYIQDPKNVSIRNGGDKKKFTLALAKISNVVADGLPKKYFVVND